MAAPKTVEEILEALNQTIIEQSSALAAIQSVLAQTQAILNSASVRAGTVTLLPATLVTTTSVVVAPANPNRKGFIAFNNSGNSTYLSLAPVSVSATCTRLVASFTSWECVTPVVYTGPISAIRNSGTGNVLIWEFT